MKRLRVYGFIALSVVIVCLVINYGYADLSALAWHIRHGSHINIGGVKVPVPLSFEASDPGGLPSLSLMRLPGILWHGGGFIDIDFRGIPSPDAQAKMVALLNSRSTIKRTKTGEHAAVFAGRQGGCSEYDVELPAPLLAVKAFEIYCHFDGSVSATFIGSPRLKGDFYNIIQSAEKIGAKK